MSEKRLLPIIAAAALLICVLSGCGNSSSSDTPADTEPAPAAEEQTDDRTDNTDTEAEAQQGAAPGSTETLFTEDDRCELNAFLSLFAEQDFAGFSDFSEDFNSLADFMHLYVKIHEAECLQSVTLPNGVAYEAVSAADADSVFSRFFGETPSADLSSGYASTGYDGDVVYGVFYNGYYCFMPADGGNFNRLAVADSAARNADGSSTVCFTVYTLDSETYSNAGGVPAEYYAFSPEDAAACGELTAAGSGTAVVVPCEDNGSSSYRISSCSIQPLS